MLLDASHFVHAWRVLRKHHRRPILAYGFPRASEAQFLSPVLSRLVQTCPDLLLVAVHFGTSPSAFRMAFPDLPPKVLHTDHRWFKLGLLPPPTVYLTSEQYLFGLPGALSLCSFHGHPAKGLSLTPEVYSSFDGFLTPGPLFDELLDEFETLYASEIPDGHRPPRFGVGYPKSDALLHGGTHPSPRQAPMPGVRPDLPTLLYAPAFNEGASLREMGLDVIEALANGGEWNVIVKLPINCYDPLSDLYSTGGISWSEAVSRITSTHPQVFFYDEFLIDPLLAHADLLVTCISSVGWEFLCLGKPVLFLDTPSYWQAVLPRRHPSLDTSTWIDSDLHNGGRRFGTVVRSLGALPDAVRIALRKPRMAQTEMDVIRKRVLYHPGRGTETMARQLLSLLQSVPSATGLKCGHRPRGLGYAWRVIRRTALDLLTRIAHP